MSTFVQLVFIIPSTEPKKAEMKSAGVVETGPEKRRTELGLLPTGR